MRHSGALLLAITAALLSGYTTVVEPKERLTKRVALLVDRSGSMRGDALARAWAVSSEIASQPVDEMQLAVFAFAEDVQRWPPPPAQEAAPPGWASLPSEVAVKNAEAWLASIGAGNTTAVVPALRQVLREPQAELSIVLITDGAFDEGDQLVMATIAEGQGWRQAQKLGPAVVMVYGIGAERANLRAIGDTGRGGYLCEAPEPTPPQPVPDPLPTVPR